MLVRVPKKQTLSQGLRHITDYCCYWRKCLWEKMDTGLSREAGRAHRLNMSPTHIMGQKSLRQQHTSWKEEARLHSWGVLELKALSEES